MLKFHKESDFHLPQSQNYLLGTELLLLFYVLEWPSLSKKHLCVFLLKHVILSAAKITSLHPTAWYFTSIYHIKFFLNLCGESLFENKIIRWNSWHMQEKVVYLHITWQYHVTVNYHTQDKISLVAIMILNNLFTHCILQISLSRCNLGRDIHFKIRQTYCLFVTEFMM